MSSHAHRLTCGARTAEVCGGERVPALRPGGQMPTLPPRNGDARDGASQAPSPTAAPRAAVLPDETALRRVFDAEFPVLVESASRELGAAAALAPRVVESAFVHAWEQRTRFETENGLNAFLRDDVHHGV